MKKINSREDLKNFKKKWNSSSIILHDTGFMFGIGCSAFNIEAVNKVSMLKNRAENKGYIVLVHSIEQLQKFTGKLSKKKLNLVKLYWPGNLTVILKNNSEKLKHIELNGKIAFRIPQNPLLIEFLKEIEQPIITTSINKSSEPFLNNISEIEDKFGSWFDLAVYKNRNFIKNSPSTIINFENEKMIPIREGSIGFQELEQSYEKPLFVFICTGNICRSPVAEIIFKEGMKDYNVEVYSAGFLKSGMKISENSKILLEENNYKVPDKRSNKINKKIVSSAYKIICMTEYHKIELSKKFPKHTLKIFTYGEISDIEGDIADPYRMDITEYRKMFNEILTKNNSYIKKIKRLM